MKYDPRSARSVDVLTDACANPRVTEDEAHNLKIILRSCWLQMRSDQRLAVLEEFEWIVDMHKETRQ